MKRLLDVVFSATLLVLLALPILILALCIQRSMGTPVFFQQMRPGRGGKRFLMTKFRTMNDVKGPDGIPLSDSERLTSLGRWLRSTSLDELPQLWNVLKGDMSLVGPRPLLIQYLDRYTPRQARRHEVRPGITGWAQVNGRNSISWEEKLELDVWYVDNQSVWLDLQILARTVLSVLRRDGVSAAGHATAPEFFGTQTASTPANTNAGDRRCES